MKNKIYLSTIIVLAMAALGLSSCLKDNSRYINFAGVGTLIELPLAATTNGLFVAEALPIQSTPQTFPLIINVASPKPLTTALKVTLEINTDSIAKINAPLLATFNADSTAYVNDTTGTVAAPAPLIQYSLPPAAGYSISSLSATVPANQREASVTITINTSVLNPSDHYLIPLTIIDASGQKISNYKTVVYQIEAKNAYDGIYTGHGFVYRDVSGSNDPNLGGNFSGVTGLPLATLGANVVSWAPIWKTGVDAAGVGNTTLTVNAATNSVIVASGDNPTLANAPGYNNHYDPGTKTFFISYKWGTAPNDRAETDTLVYSGSR